MPASSTDRAKFQPPASPDQLPVLADSSRPFVLAVVGGIGLIAIVYLMLFKPL